jgi:hypothetical protein
METIDIIITILKKNFAFMALGGYSFMPLEIYNQNNPARIFAKLSLKNERLNRKLVFTIYPRTTVEIEVYITDCNTNLSIDFKHYAEFKQGNPLKHTKQFVVDEENLSLSVDSFSAYIRSLIESNLKDVVFGKEWITFPVFDPRDDY